MTAFILGDRLHVRDVLGGTLWEGDPTLGSGARGSALPICIAQTNPRLVCAFCLSVCLLCCIGWYFIKYLFPFNGGYLSIVFFFLLTILWSWHCNVGFRDKLDKCSPWSILTKNLSSICIISHLSGKNYSVKLSGFDILFVGIFCCCWFNTFNRCRTIQILYFTLNCSFCPSKNSSISLKSPNFLAWSCSWGVITMFNVCAVWGFPLFPPFPSVYVLWVSWSSLSIVKA